MAIVLPRGILKNYSDERIRRFIISNAKVLGVVGLGGNMFKPFTNTKTIVLFLQKRYKPIDAENHLPAYELEAPVSFCVTEKPGKDKTGKIIHDELGGIVSDLPEITEYLKAHIKFSSLDELKAEYEAQCSKEIDGGK